MKIRLLTISAILLLGQGAFAQSIGGASTLLDEIAPKWHLGYSAEAAFEYALKSDTSDALSGGLSTYTASGGVKFQGAFDMRHFLTVSLGYSYSHFDFNNSANYSPFSSLNKASAILFYTFKIDEKWGIFAMGNFALGADVSECVWDGRQFGGGVGASYTFMQGLTLSVGGVAYSRMDNDWLGFPIAFLDWQVNERLTIRTMAGVTAFYDVFADKRLIVSATFEYRNSYYRLPSQLQPGGASYKRSVADSYFHFNLGATYNWTRHFYTSLNLGANFDRGLQFRTDSHKAEKIKVDAAPTVFLSAGWLF